jgi:hypothetical protein
MQVAGVEVRVNHPVLALGSTDWLMGVTRFVSLIGEAGRRRIRVAVEEPGWNAAAVDISVGPKLYCCDRDGSP